VNSLPLTFPVSDPVLIVAIATSIFLIAPRLAERAGVPGLIGLIVAGALFGPHGLGILERDATIVLLGTVGLLYLVFLAGLELDLHRFAQFRQRSIIFGFVSFGLPMMLAVLIMPMLGFGMSASLLMGAIIGSHTLLAYPIVGRLGLVQNTAVTIVVGGTLVTDTLALGLLAVIGGSMGGTLGFTFWVRLLGGLTLYVAAVFWGVPRLGRWFFRKTPGQAPAEFLFLLAVLFICAYLATLAGAQPIIGAFLAGLTLNRLIPNEGPHMTRVRFVGNALFIPFFLLSVGMLVDVRVLAESARVWVLAGAITAMVHVGKLAAALITQRAFGYSRGEGMVMFGLSLPQAAATLAVTFVGLEIGLFDEDIVNAVVVMILVTGLVGPSLVERFGQEVALQEEGKPFDPGDAPQRILVPMANPATSQDLLDLAMMIREPGSGEPIHPLTVVPSEAERSDVQVAQAEKLLSHAVAYAASADVPVVPITRMDHNFASGIARAIVETRSSTLIIGWDGRSSPHRGIFGSVLDQLLDLTKQQVLVAKLGHPLNTTQRILLLMPQGSDHLPGFLESVRTLKRMANQLGARIIGFTVRTPWEPYAEHFERLGPKVPTEFRSVGNWNDTLAIVQDEVREDDLVVVMSARRGAVSWVSMLERLPGMLARLVPQSFIMMYPSEAISPSSQQRFTEQPIIPASLSPSRIIFNVESKQYQEVLEQLLETEFGQDRDRFHAMRRTLLSSDGLSWEMLPGVVVPHARVTGLVEPLLFLGITPGGVSFPGVDEPARLIFLLLTPENQPNQHLAELAAIAGLVSDPMRFRGVVDARSFEALLQAVESV
jgi:Kef-type K+ transport system membrane component KefB/mannitol/fructose-specific phosphotransferase system IIA component (Ntr-type)/nucleotide-binding universal stress UspA family protein